MSRSAPPRPLLLAILSASLVGCAGEDRGPPRPDLRPESDAEKEAALAFFRERHAVESPNTLHLGDPVRLGDGWISVRLAVHRPARDACETASQHVWTDTVAPVDGGFEVVGTEEGRWELLVPDDPPPAPHGCGPNRAGLPHEALVDVVVTVLEAVRDAWPGIDRMAVAPESAERLGISLERLEAAAGLDPWCWDDCPKKISIVTVAISTVRRGGDGSIEVESWEIVPSGEGLPRRDVGAAYTLVEGPHGLEVAERAVRFDVTPEE